LLAQCPNGNADDRRDELQPLHVTMQADGQLLIASGLSAFLLQTYRNADCRDERGMFPRSLLPQVQPLNEE
jgi:hypothetical protein